MNLHDFQSYYARHPQVEALSKWADSVEPNVKISGLNGSSLSIALASLFEKQPHTHIFVANDADQAAYFYHDVRHILTDGEVYFFPSSFKKAIRLSQLDTANEILRTEVLSRLGNAGQPCLVFTCPEALMQKVVSADEIRANTLKLHRGERITIDFLTDVLFDFGFMQVDFVYEPGQFSVRGGIVDIFSFSFEQPYRCDFLGDEVETIRVFDIETQLSQENRTEIEILPDLQAKKNAVLVSFPEFTGNNVWISFVDSLFVKDRLNQLYDEALVKANAQSAVSDLHNSLMTGDEWMEKIGIFRKLEWKGKSLFKSKTEITFDTSLQPVFHKNFDVVSDNLKKWTDENYKLYIFSDSVKQTDRIAAIFDSRGDNIRFQAVKDAIHEGFIDHDLKIVCYTDHQVFDRFHKYQLKTDKTRRGKVALTLKELNQFQIGDYVVHVDHGIGTFGGLIRSNVNGKMQEMVKLLYKDDDIIFVSIHSLHRISKYKGKEGEAPRINKIGSGAWERLKERTKSKVKDIARELIKLYARRKAEQGFAFLPDSYLQHELEASFIYEDTPDQVKATADVKKDMESPLPMDRLVCGDVGFGKTEVAIRAAFKAATDGKQVAVLVPTTVLALQHYNTFSERLKNYPVRVEYLSRARSAKDIKDLLQQLEAGTVDIIIGTHKLVGKSVKFKDLGLLVVDEEQKFGVSVKEKLKELKVSVDTLTMTATPIPRTLQFSLMGARDLSIINTPPPNRYPVQTEIHPFDEELIKEAIQLEMGRNGQVFFINNRIQSIYLMEAMIKRLLPEVRVAVGHGQMPADSLEEIIVDFINYEYDVLVCTTIIESGVDIPNANTIIINSAHRFGLSDLHQLRGRVGRSNRKAYCYLLSPDSSLLTPEARRRLQAMETFVELGSGFNIAMQDLDIRGAGNMLGAEQSGFIADLGYETYLKILNEAMLELQEETSLPDLSKGESPLNPSQGDLQRKFVNDCQIDSDMELMFPSDYIENVSERITLYRELDAIDAEERLQEFEKRLLDRFGAIPPEGKSLILVVRLRWIAMRFGIEKLLLKNERMTAFLVSNLQSSYYQSQAFGQLLQYMAAHPYQCKLREQNGRRSVVFSDVGTVERAWEIFSEILSEIEN
ncbi:MAG: transcription-repair coupling factor [Prevotellaceae bacterium]|nr:transcription-repair coupling factor [Prevotellaceae bacterium]